MLVHCDRARIITDAECMSRHVATENTRFRRFCSLASQQPSKPHEVGVGIRTRRSDQFHLDGTEMQQSRPRHQHATAERRIHLVG